MSGNDYVRFMTETLIRHFNVPKEERKLQRKQRKEARDPLVFRLFGLMPLSLSIAFRKVRRR